MTRPTVTEIALATQADSQAADRALVTASPGVRQALDVAAASYDADTAEYPFDGPGLPNVPDFRRHIIADLEARKLRQVQLSTLVTRLTARRRAPRRERGEA